MGFAVGFGRTRRSYLIPSTLLCASVGGELGVVKGRRRARPEGTAIPATEAAKNFGRLVDRVRETRATYTIERSGKAVARIGPVESRKGTLADFKEWARTAPHVDEEYLRELEDICAAITGRACPGTHGDGSRHERIDSRRTRSAESESRRR